MEIAGEGRLISSRPELIRSFWIDLRPDGPLDEYQLRGVFAAWWFAWHNDLRVIDTYGFQALLDQWLAAGIIHARAVHGHPRDTVLSFLGMDLVARTQALVVAERQKLVDLFMSWGERYGSSLNQLEAAAQGALQRLDQRLRDLGYVADWEV